MTGIKDLRVIKSIDKYKQQTKKQIKDNIAQILIITNKPKNTRNISIIYKFSAILNTFLNVFKRTSNIWKVVFPFDDNICATATLVTNPLLQTYPASPYPIAPIVIQIFFYV